MSDDVGVVRSAAKHVDKTSKYKNDENDLTKNNTKNSLPNKISGDNILEYDNDVDDDQDDGFSASNHGEDEGETDADDEIEEEGMKGSDRTPDSLLSPISDEMPPAKGWV